MKKEDIKIDFVISWVDGNDPAWMEEFLKYRELYTVPRSPEEPSSDNTNGEDVFGYGNPADTSTIDATAERYRDPGTLRYWFRGVERFAPWVNRVHLLTWGHIPAWIDASNPKLHIVPHEEFIPGQYLPTFNSCPIELNIHRIEGLTEHFVYFNDDMFLCRPVTPDRFFKDGLPCDNARLNLIPAERIGHNILECTRLANARHDKRKSMRRDAGKWFNYRYSLPDMLKTATLLPWSFFPGFKDFHIPQPFLKETFYTLWNEEERELDATCRSRFRTPADLSQWAVRYEQLASGRFHPVSMKDTGLAKLSDDNAAEIKNMLLDGRYSMICINDNNLLSDPDAAGRELRMAFDRLLPQKSSYEL